MTPMWSDNNEIHCILVYVYLIGAKRFSSPHFQLFCIVSVIHHFNAAMSHTQSKQSMTVHLAIMQSLLPERMATDAATVLKSRDDCKLIWSVWRPETFAARNQDQLKMAVMEVICALALYSSITEYVGNIGPDFLANYINCCGFIKVKPSLHAREYEASTYTVFKCSKAVYSHPDSSQIVTAVFVDTFFGNKLCFKT